MTIYARVSTARQSCERELRDLGGFAERCGQAAVGVFREIAAPYDGQPLSIWRDVAGIAQFERDMLSERVRFGLAAARARG